MVRSTQTADIRRALARLSFPAEPLLKVRAVFVLLGMATVIPLAPVVGFRGDGPALTRVAVIAVLASAGVRRVLSFRRGRLTFRGDALEAAAIFGVCASVDTDQRLGLLFTAVFLRPLYGPLHHAAIATVAYISAFGAGVAAQSAELTETIVTVAEKVPVTVCTVIALGVLARTLDDHGRAERRFRALVRNSSDVITVTDTQGRISYQSDAVTDVLGWEADDAIGRFLLDAVHAEDAPAFAEHFSNAVADGAQRAMICRMQHRDGTWRWIESTVVNRLDDAAVEGVIIHSRDVGVRKELEDRLRQMAFHDELTGLANRARLNDRVAHALGARRRDGKAVGMLVIDLDGFKAVNDTLGHAAGDLVLVELARRIADETRAEDTVARLGGDEFAVFVHSDADASCLAQVAARLLPALTCPINVAGTRVSLGASIGGVVADWNVNPHALLRDADAAMYVAKQSGGGFELYGADLTRASAGA